VGVVCECGVCEWGSVSGGCVSVVSESGGVGVGVCVGGLRRGG
jgi:hypothetical protein